MLDIPEMLVQQQDLFLAWLVCRTFTVGLGCGAGFSYFRSPRRQAIKEISGLHMHDFANVPHSARAYPIRARFIFLDLLKAHIEHFCKFLLRQAKLYAPITQLLSDMNIYWVWHCLSAYSFDH